MWGLFALLALSSASSAFAESCPGNSTTLCLNNQRFKVEVTWKDFDGNTGVGHAVSLTSDTGYFWFFGSSNVELVVKVLDGRGLNGHFWVFFGALSSVEYTMVVTDSTTGSAKTYFNPSGQFASIGDTEAFSASGTVGAAYQQVVNDGSMFAIPISGIPLAAVPAAETTSTCVGTEKSLCLNGGRFRVEVNWKDFEGNTGVGKAVPLTSDTGYFWFFGSTNVELVVKVLDARTLNNRFWVFYGALSSVEYDITVTDTSNGDVRRYRNPAQRFASTGDTEAFPPEQSPASKLARELAEKISRAKNDGERQQALLEILQAIRVGVYTPSGGAVLRGAERGPGDFYLYDFEVQMMSQSLERRATWTISDLTAFINEMGILRAGVKIQSEDMKQVLLKGTRAAVQDPDNPRSLAALVVRELGLRQTTPYDAAVNMDIQSARFDALQYFLIQADLLLPIVRKVGPINVTSRLGIESGGIFGQRKISPQDFTCETIGNEVKDTWEVGQYVVDYLGIVNETLEMAIVIIDGIHGVALAYGVEVKALDTLLKTHYGHQSPGQELHFRVLVNMLANLPRFVTCGWLPGVDLPTKGPIAGVRVVWLHDLQKHGEVICEIGCTTTTASDGVATLVFKPKKEAEPGAGTLMVDTGLVEGISLHQLKFDNKLGQIAQILVPQSGTTRWEVEFHEEGYELVFDSFIAGRTGYLSSSRAIATVPLRVEEGKGYTGTASLNYRTEGSGCDGFKYSGDGDTRLDVTNGRITPPSVPGGAADIQLTLHPGLTAESCVISTCAHGDVSCNAPGGPPSNFWTSMFNSSRGLIGGSVVITGWTYVGTNEIFAEKTLTGNCAGRCNETTRLILRRRVLAIPP